MASGLRLPPVTSRTRVLDEDLKFDPGIIAGCSGRVLNTIAILQHKLNPRRSPCVCFVISNR